MRRRGEETADKKCLRSPQTENDHASRVKSERGSYFEENSKQGKQF